MKNAKDKNIKQQMSNTLFKKRKVKFDQSIYLFFFDKIFPEYMEFDKFLYTAGKDSMIKHAKNIVNRLLFESPWNGMQELYRNLMKMETSLLSDSENGYVSQDHAIHSVHLYILGIYLYFNFSVFHEVLIKYFKKLKDDIFFNHNDYAKYTKEQKTFLVFFEAWKCFSLLHDIAYPYENLFDADGSIDNSNTKFLSAFDKLDAYIQYHYTMKYLVELILTNIIIQDSTSCLGKQTYTIVKIL